MDAYDLSNAVKQKWVDHSDKRSGMLEKDKNHMAVMVWTEEGYREVVGVFFNKDINAIELILDQE